MSIIDIDAMYEKINDLDKDQNTSHRIVYINI